MYTIRISCPYERDEVYERDTLEKVKEFLKIWGYTTRQKLYYVDVYLTPDLIDASELMGVGKK